MNNTKWILVTVLGMALSVGGTHMVETHDRFKKVQRINYNLLQEIKNVGDYMAVEGTPSKLTCYGYRKDMNYLAGAVDLWRDWVFELLGDKEGLRFIEEQDGMGPQLDNLWVLLRERCN